MLFEFLYLLLVLFSTFGVCMAQRDSSDTESDTESEVMECHEFIVKKTVFKSGKRAGEVRWLVTLEVPPYTFRRQKETGTEEGTAYFSCNSCSKIRVNNVYATAKKAVSCDGVPKYHLMKLPSNHACAPSPTMHLVKRFNAKLIEEVAKDPTKSVMKIFDSVRLEFVATLSHEAKTSFLQEISSFRGIQACMYRKRREFIPSAPKTFQDFNAQSKWFMIAPSYTESLIKCDVYNHKQGRIITLATKESLEILARSDSISGDGTFKTSPKLWSQLFIMSCEVQPDIWVPCTFSFLPDKTYETYQLHFSSLKKCLNDNGLLLSARWFMADFELGIRKAVTEELPDVHIKGCHFHYSKALWGKVVDYGMKTAYSKPNNEKLTSLIRSAIGLAKRKNRDLSYLDESNIVSHKRRR